MNQLSENMDREIHGNTKTYEYVFQYFSDQIFSGKMKIGDKIRPEREIAEKLGVSRNSIREVMHMFEINGLIECVQGSGNYVRCTPQEYMTVFAHMIITLMDIGYEEILYIRIGFELVALRQAITNAGEEELEQIHEALLNMEKAQTKEESVFWDQEFHKRLIESSHNRMLILYSSMIREITNRFISDLRVKILSTQEKSDELGRSHWGIYDALVNKDYISGSVAMNRHFEIVGNELLS